MGIKSHPQKLMAKNLTVKERMFVRGMIQGLNGKEALLQAGYKPTSNDSAYQMVNQLIKREKIQNALQNAIEAKYPDIPGQGAEMLHGILTSADSTNLEKLKALEVLMKIFGWIAPTKHANLNVSVSDQFKLPGGDE